MRNFLALVTRNVFGLVGTLLTTVSAVLFVTLFALEQAGFHGGPYLGILAFLILPAFFVLGLLLIPLGVFREHQLERRARASGAAPPALPVIDLNRPRTRNVLLIFAAATLANLAIVAVATYKGVEVMDSTSFCGGACHSVMQPEYTAYERSPHARVACVSCHIGPGANWFVKSKLSGSWQVVSVAFNLYPRPIPVPIHDLRPARETCEQCHWPSKFVGDRLKVITRFAEDEANTELKTILLLRVGGTQARRAHGIHWHVDPANRIRYRADPARQVIHEVEMAGADGTVKRFLAPKAEQVKPVDQEWRVMDCVDCHNRPTHIYRLPEEEIDLALAEGRLDRGLPYLRREGRRLLQGPYPTREAAREAMGTELTAFYGEHYPQLAGSRQEQVDAAAAELGRLYGANVFPSMNVTWGTYPSHLGHTTAPGCFRCHDEEHVTADGKAISQDCSTCHSVLAQDEKEPDILKRLME